MKISLIKLLSRGVVGAFLLSLGACSTDQPGPEKSAAMCPPKYPHHYANTAHGFGICLPASVKKTSDSTNDNVTFAGFAVPKGTNLQSKMLTIVAGNYDMMTGATPFGQLTADGVVFKRVKFEEGSAGHMDLHIIYTWKKQHEQIHFDFVHHSVNVLNFDPADRPQEYSPAAQTKISEEIMLTFRRL